MSQEETPSPYQPEPDPDTVDPVTGAPPAVPHDETYYNPVSPDAAPGDREPANTVNDPGAETPAPDNGGEPGAPAPPAPQTGA